MAQLLTPASAPEPAQTTTTATAARCTTCGEVFRSVEDMRSHYATSWHQQNVRLRVDGRPPMTKKEFNQFMAKHGPEAANPGVMAAMLMSGTRSVVGAKLAGGNAPVRILSTSSQHSAAGGAATVLASRHSAVNAAGPADDEELDKPAVFNCKLCRKSFKSVQTLQSHVRSTEHLMNKEAKIIARDSQAGSAISTTSLGSAAIGLHKRHRAHQRDRMKVSEALRSTYADPNADKAGPAVPPEERELDVSETKCFFCGKQSTDMAANIDHLAVEHQFYIPLPHRCVDKLGLLQYLARKVNGLMCFVCGEKTKKFVSLEALRGHMKEMQHDRVILSSEYDSFYDTLDNGEPAAILDARDAEGRLVLATGGRSGGKTKLIFPKGESFLIGRKVETQEQQDQRRALTYETYQAEVMLLKERAEERAPQEREERKLFIAQRRIRNKADMQNGVRNNKLHPKGYDGEGEMA